MIVHTLFDGFAGFDIDISLFQADSLSLSSLFRPPEDQGDSPVSEVYVVYGRGL